ncbi:MAG TPA: ABC transporter permease [Woeseiaceae bacterium]|nr:ABC transporter permease [Woeseiaceae bacterium]
MRRAEAQFGLLSKLACRDFAYERVMSACFVLSLSAVLLPLLVLFGLKFGIISNLLSPLNEDPRYRQILPTGSGRFGPDWFEAMTQRSDVEFIVPRTRAIAASMRLRAPENRAGRIIDVELIPSAAGDPVLDGLDPPLGFKQVVLSLDAADKLGVKDGDSIEGIVSRTRADEQQTELLPLRVTGVASAAAFSRDGMFVSQDLIVAIEDFRDGRAVPALGWEGSETPIGPRYFAGFRLYARELDDVAGLRTGLIEQGIDVRTRLADIELVQALDRNLAIVFWIIAVIAAAGFGLAFGSSIWANVDRKRREFSVLRLTGFRSRGIVWFPIVQALLTGVLGWILASTVFFAVQAGLNTLFAGSIGGEQPVCRLLPVHFLIALMMTLITAVIAALLGGLKLARLEPSLGLREA